MMAIGQLINLTSQGQASLKRINAMLEEDVEIKDQRIVLIMKLKERLPLMVFRSPTLIQTRLF